MFIRSNSYQLKDTDNEIFTTLFTNEFSVSYVVSVDNKVVFSSRNEVFVVKDDKSVKKLTGMDSDVTALTVSGGFICIGAASGAVKILADLKNCVRSYTEHTAAVNDIKVAVIGDEKEVIAISCSDDSTIRMFRLVEESSFATIQHENRYINSIDFFNGLIVGVSDKLEVYSTIDRERIFSRSFEQKISHVAAISEEQFVFAINNSIGTINIKTGHIQDRIAHTRPVEQLLVYKDVIYTASCDGHFRSFLMNLKLVSDFNLREKISGFCIENDRPVISLVTGSILWIEDSSAKGEVKKPIIRAQRAGYEDDIDYEVLGSGKKRLTDIEALLNRFEYKACLKLAMKKSDPTIGYSVLLHIRNEHALKKVLSEENSDFVEDFLVFCTENIQIQEYKHLIMEGLTIITSVYSEMIIGNEELRELLRVLSLMISEEIQFQEICLQAVSFLDGFKAKI
ncbi:hypothetical protein PAEPH01_0235 [Pancytospora epiphaga]|nr:hypothetical protein PAEPH01_0235 [Pancytospora epiphaga]